MRCTVTIKIFFCPSYWNTVYLTPRPSWQGNSQVMGMICGSLCQYEVIASRMNYSIKPYVPLYFQCLREHVLPGFLRKGVPLSYCTVFSYWRTSRSVAQALRNDAVCMTAGEEPAAHEVNSALVSQHGVTPPKSVTSVAGWYARDTSWIHYTVNNSQMLLGRKVTEYNIRNPTRPSASCHCTPQESDTQNLQLSGLTCLQSL